MFQDEQRYEVWERIRQQDLRTFARLLPHSLFVEAAERAGVDHVARGRLSNQRVPPQRGGNQRAGAKRISRDDWVRMATESEPGRPLDRRVRLRMGLGLDHRRWEIETTFHELKAVQGLERSLRSRTPESIHYDEEVAKPLRY